MKRTASAQWTGDLTTGGGTLSTATGVLSSTPYSYKSRFEQGSGTNPEELLAAAHAGCFTMALSLALGQAGMKPQSLETTCTITLEKRGEGFSITQSHLDLKAKVPGASKEAFENAVQQAKTNCPVSKLFSTEITLNSTLESQQSSEAAAKR
ncbi:MAG: OsmC family protein [Bryobacteraceae bacterium]